MGKLEIFEKALVDKKKQAKFAVGDTVCVSMKIVEEGKTRIQDFEGICIGKKGSGIRSVFTVRRISYGEGVERVFPINSPMVDKIVVKKKGTAHRAKLYFLRKKVGKKGKIDEKIEKAQDAAENSDALPRKEGE